MRKIEAIIRQEKLSDVKDALANAGFLGLTTYNVKGRGRQTGYELSFRGRKHRIDLLPKTKIELVVNKEDAEEIVHIIQKEGYTGEIGDGKIFIYPISEVVRVRTGERGKKAI
jgi:nitrogen regulatory protein P-II 1